MTLLSFQFLPPPRFRRWMNRFARRWHKRNGTGCTTVASGNDVELPVRGPRWRIHCRKRDNIANGETNGEENKRCRRHNRQRRGSRSPTGMQYSHRKSPCEEPRGKGRCKNARWEEQNDVQNLKAAIQDGGDQDSGDRNGGN